MSSSKKRFPIISKRDIIQIFLFFGLCVYMSNCAANQKRSVGQQSSKSVLSREAKLRAEITQYAKRQIGTKYKYAGRSPKGFDCSGLTHYVMNEFGINLTPNSGAQENEGKVISITTAKPGDLVFFRRKKKGNVYHVGLVLENGRDGIVMIHSSSSRGVVKDVIQQNSYWRTKVMTARDVINR